MLKQKVSLLIVSSIIASTISTYSVANGEVNSNNANTKKGKSVVINKEDLLNVELPEELQIIPIEELNQKVQEKREEMARIEREREEERLRLEEELRLLELQRQPHFNPYNLLEPSNVTREQMYAILEGTALQSLSNGYVYMEELYGINALFLVAISAYESGWGTSSLAIYNNNLGGIKANDGSWAYFNDWFECISYKTDLLYNQYLIPTGAYYNGTSTWNINVRYCEEGYWADNINAIAYELLSKIGG